MMRLNVWEGSAPGWMSFSVKLHTPCAFLSEIKFSLGWPGYALEDQLLSAPALPPLQNLFVVFDGDAVSMVPLENFKSLLAS